MSERYLKLLIFITVFVGNLVLMAQTINVDWNQPHQRIDGFGVAMAAAPELYTHPQRDAVMDLLFDKTSGMGFSILRVEIPDNLEPTPETWDFSQDSAQVWYMQQARVRGVSTLMATCWSMPGWMKTNGTTTHGGYLIAGDYQVYAEYLSEYVLKYQSLFGLDIDAVSISNEPNFVAHYDSTQWTSTNFHDFILNNLGPTFQNNGVNARIIMPEQGSWNMKLAPVTENDPQAAQYIGILAAHGYFTAVPAQHFTSKWPVWQTEDSNLTSQSVDISDALHWALRVNSWMVDAEANAWNYWWGAHQSLPSIGDTLINLDATGYTPYKRLYTIGQFSRFIRPGFVRLASTQPGGWIHVSAYKDPATGQFVLVAINTGGSQNLTVNLNTNLQWLNKYVTTENTNQAFSTVFNPVPATFTVSLPASSVSTFVGN